MVVPSPSPPASHGVVSSSVRFARWLALSLPFCVAGCYSGHPNAGGDSPWTNVGEDTDSHDDGDTPGATGASGASSNGGSSGDGAGDGDDDGGTGGELDTGLDDGGQSTSGADDGLDGDGDTGADDGADDDGGAGDDGGNGNNGNDDVPNSAYCQDAATWSAQWGQLEQEILTLVNQRRAQGANCGGEGNFGAAPPLVMNPALRCASRNHSKDMAVNNYFSHTNLQGQSPFVRMGLAGYSYSAAGENIAAGNATAAATMQQWMNSPGHCANIMNPNFQELGVGYHPGGSYGHYWTQKFGRP